MKLLFDAHLDLSMNALEWNGDLRLVIIVLKGGREAVRWKAKLISSSILILTQRHGRERTGKFLHDIIARGIIITWYHTTAAAPTRRTSSWWRDARWANSRCTDAK